MATLEMATKNLKDTAQALSELLTSNSADPQIVKDLLYELGYRDQQVQDEPISKYETVDHVGIYRMEEIDGERSFKRDINMKEKWSFYADVDKIPPKKNKKRVALLGESVARGFLLDPDYTPASVLNLLLQSRADLFDFEVVDLAETNLRMDDLKKRFYECLMMDPDVIVFFAGNNWRDDMVDIINVHPEYTEAIAQAMKKSGSISGAKSIVEGIFRERVVNLIREIGQASKKVGVPVVYAIPEFNLLDCQSTPAERFITKLKNEEIQEWILARIAAEKALAEKDYGVVELNAAKMIQLDPTHPQGYELMANCRQYQSLFDEARNYLEAARDTALYFRTNSKPRIFRVFREAILSEAERNGITVVDVPALFKDYLGGGIPGRNLFLDYCHLTVEGIQVVAEAIGAKVLTLLAGPQALPGIKARSIHARPETISMGHVFAAIHNAHWGQYAEILRYHCLQAVKASPISHKLMIYYIDMISRMATNTLCKSFRQLLPISNLDKYIHLLMNPRKFESMEIELVDAMVYALKEVGIDATAYVHSIRKMEHSIAGRKINLLNSHYCKTSYEKHLGTRTSFFQARHSCSKFFLVAGKGDAVLLNLTLRIPESGQRHNEVLISINDAKAIKVPAENVWTDQTILLPGDLMLDGLNLIELIWPLPSAGSADVHNNGAATARIGEDTILDAAYYTFGEIYSFTAKLRLQGQN